MDILPINAADLLQDPDQSALHQALTQFEVSQEPGLALYFAKGNNPRIRRPDFLLGLVDRAYFALQVADQPHGVRDDKLVLLPAAGAMPTLSPVGSVAAHAVGASKDVQKRLGYHIYVMPVAVFVGEDPDNTVQDWAIAHNVRLLFTTDRLVERLADIAQEYAAQIYRPPTLAEIQQVIGLFNAEGTPPAELVSEPNPVHSPDAGLTARQVVIQHTDTVNVYTIGGAASDGARDGREVDLNTLL